MVSISWPLSVLVQFVKLWLCVTMTAGGYNVMNDDAIMCIYYNRNTVMSLCCDYIYAKYSRKVDAVPQLTVSDIHYQCNH